MIDEQFRFSRVHVCVAAIGDSGEALLIRGLLESLGASVSLHWVGVPQDLLLVLNDPAPPGRYLILSGHGDASGIVFGEYSEESIPRCFRTGGCLLRRCAARFACRAGS